MHKLKWVNVQLKFDVKHDGMLDLKCYILRHAVILRFCDVE